MRGISKFNEQKRAEILDYFKKKLLLGKISTDDITLKPEKIMKKMELLTDPDEFRIFMQGCISKREINRCMTALRQRKITKKRSKKKEVNNLHIDKRTANKLKKYAEENKTTENNALLYLMRKEDEWKDLKKLEDFSRSIKSTLYSSVEKLLKSHESYENTADNKLTSREKIEVILFLQEGIKALTYSREDGVYIISEKVAVTKENRKKLIKGFNKLKSIW